MGNKAILIADSGSTKTDWRLLNSSREIEQAKTAGFNPFYQSEEDIRTELVNELLPQLSVSPDAVFFYGAGCSDERNRALVGHALRDVFPDASVEVEHDLLAVARALCGNEPGIACILGTGSNSCLYDGRSIVMNVPSLGFMLGDEGSGGFLGKLLVTDYLNGDLPKPLAKRFMSRYNNLSKEEILENVYKKPFPNRYMASFSKFLFDHAREPYAFELVFSAFKLFLRKNVCKYPDYREYPTHFTGSVAFYFNSILRAACEEYGIVLQKVTESPIAGLLLFHSEFKE